MVFQVVTKYVNLLATLPDGQAQAQHRINDLREISYDESLDLLCSGQRKHGERNCRIVREINDSTLHHTALITYAVDDTSYKKTLEEDETKTMFVLKKHVK